MYLRNLINYPAANEVAYAPTQEEIIQFFSSNHEPKDEAEADNIQESIPVKATESLQCANLLQQLWMQEYIVDHEMLTATG